LNEAGLCPSCRTRPNCASHAERVSTGRCLRCRAYFCKECLNRGLCAACKDLPPLERKRRPPAAQPQAPAPAKRDPGRRKQLQQAGVALVLLLGLVQGGAWAYDTFGPPAGLRLCNQRLAATASAVQAAIDQTGKPPRDAEALAAALRQQKGPSFSVLAEGAAAQPNAVYYKPLRKGFELRVTDGQGRFLERDGQPLVVSGS
jgi:hypothetical protein